MVVCVASIRAIGGCSDDDGTVHRESVMLAAVPVIRQQRHQRQQFFDQIAKPGEVTAEPFFQRAV